MYGEMSLNPCCNGRYSQSTVVEIALVKEVMSLNPCCNGRYSQSGFIMSNDGLGVRVLILVVMEDTLRV